MSFILIIKLTLKKIGSFEACRAVLNGVTRLVKLEAAWPSGLER